jgi:hypothetical protein
VKIDFSGIDPRIEREFLEGRRFKVVNAAIAAMRNQAKLNALARAGGARAVTGLGAPSAYLDQVVAHYWREREHKRVWEDPSHWRYMHRHGLIEKVKTTGTKTGSTVGWTKAISQPSTFNLQPSTKPVKFHKSYG